MIVFYVVPSLKNCGPINQALNLGTGFLNDKSIRFIIVSLYSHENSKLNAFRARNIEVIEVYHSFNIFKIFVKLQKLIFKYQPYIIQSAGVFSSILLHLSFYNGNIYHTQRSIIKEIFEGKHNIFYYVLKKIYFSCLKRSNGVITCSNSLYYDIKENLNISAKVIYNSVDTNYFQIKESSSNSFGIPSEKSIFIFTGPNNERKNISFLIDAFNNLIRNDFFLIIIGKNCEILKSEKKNEKILILDEVDCVLKYLQLADFYISASSAEGFPNSVLEALSCGLFPILSNIGPHKEMIFSNSSKYGTLFELDNSSNLTKILENFELDKTISKNNLRNFCLQNFSIEQMSKKYKCIYSNGNK